LANEFAVFKGTGQTGVFPNVSMTGMAAVDLDVSLSDLGVTSSAAELNLLDGVTETMKQLNNASKRVSVYQVEDLAAGGDIATRAIMIVPTGKKATITDVKVISQGTAAGIDDSNTCVIAVTSNTDSIVSKTYNTSVTFPADGAAESLGSLNATNKVMAAGKYLKFAVTNGATANTPLFALQVEYTYEDA
jgi:hypothetical protein